MHLPFELCLWSLFSQDPADPPTWLWYTRTLGGLSAKLLPKNPCWTVSFVPSARWSSKDTGRLRAPVTVCQATVGAFSQQGLCGKCLREVCPHLTDSPGSCRPLRPILPFTVTQLSLPTPNSSLNQEPKDIVRSTSQDLNKSKSLSEYSDRIDRRERLFPVEEYKQFTGEVVP